MDNWLNQLRADLDHLEARHLLRSLQSGEPNNHTTPHHDRALVNLSSNDYLGISSHPSLKAAACEAIQAHATGAGASRLAGGHLPIHARVESQFAQFKHAEAALLCPTGYMANLAAVTALAGKGDLICLDKLNHASLFDAARLSGARVRNYPHLHTAKLERILDRHANASSPHTPRQPHPPRPPRRFIITDSIFSMDGDTADLPALCDLADRYDAILIVDEAHATGVLGETGSGLCEVQGVGHRVDIVISTASKALGGLGGIITAPRTVIETVVNRARSFIYTTAVPPAQAATLEAALGVVRDEPWRRERVQELSQRLRATLLEMKLAPAHTPANDITTPIVPIMTGSPEAALDLSNHLSEHGFFAPAIRPPTVPPGTARVRITLRADLEDEHLENLVHALSQWRQCTA